ncbi:hypothetical protein FSDG_01490 [Fusobacterium animalis 7_1]|jgi:hypothetical protein|uniref:Uncharacterized protein n=1 Tax=Fusobacterium animalis 7_1 TaxID=457405 RepID=A0A140PUV3_9FUSO|nr:MULTISPECIES: hypothetical protein [Fusobacterium]EEO42931.1 hypothetical protein FSDG_01490 [Fusobacterium animalis 7_1]EPC08361.1 hypothetical protein HMPREF9369_03164 [Fusobacterium polymorphum F0401]
MENIDLHNEKIRKLVKTLYLDDIKRDKTKDEREISFNIREIDNEIVFAREILGKEVEFFKIDKENLEIFGKFQAIIDEEGNKTFSGKIEDLKLVGNQLIKFNGEIIKEISSDENFVIPKIDALQKDEKSR